MTTLRKNILYSAVIHSAVALCVMLTIRSVPLQGRIFSVELEGPVVEHQAGKPAIPAPPSREIQMKKAPAVLQKKEQKVVPQETRKEPVPAAQVQTEERPHTVATESGPALLAEHSVGEGRAAATQDSTPSVASGDHFALHLQEAPGPAGQATMAVSGGSQSGIIAQIRQSIEKAIIYPPLARKRKQEGTVVAEFFLNGRGFPDYVRVVRSSGFAPLDAAAQQAVNRAAPFPIVRGTIEVPITFRLEKNH